MMARYIDADALCVKLHNKIINPQTAFINNVLIELLRREPVADVREVIHAKWIISSNGYYPYCSNCKNEPESGVMSNYCPSCGAKIKKERCGMSSVSLINGHIDDDKASVEVIRCKDCIYCHGQTCVSIFSGVLYVEHPNYYCSCGKRRDT